MFIKNNDNGLVFIKSKNINAFPCGRRRSNPIDADNNNDTVSDRYYIPFDPEARLNTESNNRKHSSINGFKQSYVHSWTSGSFGNELAIVINGYLFTIKLDSGYTTPNTFGAKLEDASYLGSSAKNVYATIKLADVKFFSGSADILEATTEVLRDQVFNDEPSLYLDCPIDSTVDKTKSDSYYFSGLSLSSTDLTDSYTNTISLKLLTKNDSGWELYNPSKLPEVDHGDTRDSVKIKGDLFIQNSDYSSGDINVTGNITLGGQLSATSVDVNQLKQNGHTATLLDIITINDTSNNTKYQLKFTGAVKN